ncbi:MAG: GbsR/MarR family transcriptional regulator [Intrasporangium sp.]|uniref:GbsR/MarR family transcriptional regulator n=1 Tax=Intrasporangium sp. TaxID=1925024 RepID=UPI003F80BC4C
MTAMRDDKAVLDFTEELGLLVESEGWMPRIAGRALGWLLLAPEPQSQADLCEALQASGGAVSAATRLLISKGLVQKVTRPGDRRTYMKVPPSAWRVMEEDGLQTVRRYRRVAEKARAALPKGNEMGETNLTRMSDYFGIVEERMQAVLKRLDAIE